MRWKGRPVPYFKRATIAPAVSSYLPCARFFGNRGRKDLAAEVTAQFLYFVTLASKGGRPTMRTSTPAHKAVKLPLATERASISRVVAGMGNTHFLSTQVRETPFRPCPFGVFPWAPRLRPLPSDSAMALRRDMLKHFLGLSVSGQRPSSTRRRSCERFFRLHDPERQ